MLLRQLATGGIDVVAARVADRGLDANLSKATHELLGTLGGGGLELGALEVIELDEVHMGKRATREVAQGVKLEVVVVDSPDEGVLVGRPAAGGLDVLGHGVMQPCEGVLLDARHDGVARRLDGGMQRDGQRELLGLLGKAANHGNDAAGRYREVACANAGALGRVEHAQGLKHLVVVVERLALAHHDNGGGAGLEVLAHVHDLVVDLGCLEGAGEAALARGAEDAAHAAARLGGDADGEAVAVGHANALGLGAVIIAEQVLAAAVVGDLAGNLDRSAKGAALGKVGAQLGRDVGHVLEVGDVVLPHPILELLRAELGVAKPLEELDELLMGNVAKVDLGLAGVDIIKGHVAAFLA